MASLSLRTRSRLLSNTDASILKDYGRNTTQDLTRIISETIFLSIYGVFFALAVYSILRRGLRSRISIIMLLVVMYLFGASMVQWVVDLFQLIKNFHNLFTTTDVPIPDRIDLAVDTFEKFALLQELLFVLNMIIADAVVIWRTWAVWQGRIAAIVMPCVLLLAAFVFVLIDITCNAYDGTKPLPGGGVICPQASKTVWALSVTTNIVCTLLIGFKAWQHRKMMKQLNMGRKVRGMSIENILSLLVESGFIYSFLWLIQVIPYLDITRASPWWYVIDVLQGLGYTITGLYPTLIIVIVNFNRTIWEEHPVSLGTAALESWAVNSNPSGKTRSFRSRSKASI